MVDLLINTIFSASLLDRDQQQREHCLDNKLSHEAGCPSPKVHCLKLPCLIQPHVRTRREFTLCRSAVNQSNTISLSQSHVDFNWLLWIPLDLHLQQATSHKWIKPKHFPLISDTRHPKSTYNTLYCDTPFFSVPQIRLAPCSDAITSYSSSPL